MYNVLTEVTLLSEKDCFNIAERHKSDFSYPLHCHKEFELNFVQNAPGVKRIIGDSVETIDVLDLVLIGGENLEHVWEQGECTSKDIREITIQFHPDLFTENILSRNQFFSIKQMFEKAQHGISFSMEGILKAYNILDNLANETDSFIQFTMFLNMLYILSKYEYKVLASNTFANVQATGESQRITAVKDYINDHFTEKIMLEDLAAIAGMSPSAFSRFFKTHTNKTLSEHIIETKLGYAARCLVSTSMNISEICYASGFNNMSNFNRIFRDRKGMTPKEFRAMYKKNKVIV